jgi:hypothetical protein
VKRFVFRLFLLCLPALFALSNMTLAQQQPREQQQPADASGKWNFYCRDPRGGTSTKYIELEQKGASISGHFKGPNQSGGVAGTITNQHIVFHTRTREVLTFGGRVDGPRVDGRVIGDKITGNFHARAGTGSFEAVHASN